MFTVIIPSKTAANLKPCLEALRACEPDLPPDNIVVIDDADDASVYAICLEAPARSVKGQKPFVFSANVNLGIVAAGVNDVVILNDDALLKTSGGFSYLAEVVAKHPDIGIIAPVTNVTGQSLQMPKGIGLRQVPHIAFVCVLIPRRTIEKLGPLDERYCIDYGVEDRDYCEAVNRAGLKVCVHDSVFVDHGSLVSSFRGDPKTPKSFAKNYELFKQKWAIR